MRAAHVHASYAHACRLRVCVRAPLVQRPQLVDERMGRRQLRLPLHGHALVHPARGVAADPLHAWPACRPGAYRHAFVPLPLRAAPLRRAAAPRRAALMAAAAAAAAHLRCRSLKFHRALRDSAAA